MKSVSIRINVCVWILPIAFMICGCEKSSIKNSLNSAKDQLRTAYEAGGKFCAPKDTASAEAFLDFSQHDLKAGDLVEAKDYLNYAKGHLASAMEKCRDCKTDLDYDTILDIKDGDPYRAEDFDGYKDHDGIPDYDNDADGIPDINDPMPNAPEDFDGFKDNDGIPDPDNDHDGIPDEVDLCPNEPEDIDGFQDTDGCPDPDNDMDGYPDWADLCPNAPSYDNDGCPAITVSDRKLLNLPIIEFYPRSAKLTPASKNALANFSKVLIDNPNIALKIEGHTDDQGDPAKLMELSYQRAELIRDILVNSGVGPDRMIAAGFGGTKPLVPNMDLKSRRQNNRITFIIYYR